MLPCHYLCSHDLRINQLRKEGEGKVPRTIFLLARFGARSCGHGLARRGSRKAVSVCVDRNDQSRKGRRCDNPQARRKAWGEGQCKEADRMPTPHPLIYMFVSVI